MTPHRATLILLAAALYCSPATTDAWFASPGNLHVLPVRPCIIPSCTSAQAKSCAMTGDFRCDRKHGCLKCNIAIPCPELKS
jgi:hypothetical protein